MRECGNGGLFQTVQRYDILPGYSGGAETRKGGPGVFQTVDERDVPAQCAAAPGAGGCSYSGGVPQGGLCAVWRECRQPVDQAFPAAGGEPDDSADVPVPV